MKNGSQAANERFFAFPEIRLIYRFQTYLSLIIFVAKKILSRGEAIFQRSLQVDALEDGSEKSVCSMTVGMSLEEAFVRDH